jgi:hypothetical protein
MRNIDKERLTDLYLEQKLNPYEIAILFQCDHKTVRRYLKLYEIQLRSASEYNFLAHKNYIQPSVELLNSSKSIAAHIAYLCEGWHTEKTDHVYFCNTDSQLIQLIVWLLTKVYQVRNIRYELVTADDTSLLQVFPKAKVVIDKNRKTPIIRIKSGGKMLARDLIQNAYSFLKDLD